MKQIISSHYINKFFTGSQISVQSTVVHFSGSLPTTVQIRLPPYRLSSQQHAHTLAASLEISKTIFFCYLLASINTVVSPTKDSAIVISERKYSPGALISLSEKATPDANVLLPQSSIRG